MSSFRNVTVAGPGGGTQIPVTVTPGYIGVYGHTPGDSCIHVHTHLVSTLTSLNDTWFP